MSDELHAIGGWCLCRVRIEATKAGMFAPAFDGDGWVFDGEHWSLGAPKRWQECPYCGRTLPTCSLEQGDGWQGENDG